MGKADRLFKLLLPPFSNFILFFVSGFLAGSGCRLRAEGSGGLVLRLLTRWQELLKNLLNSIVSVAFNFNKVAF